MSAPSALPHEAARGPRQFSLRFVLLCVLALCVGLAIVARFPRQSAFAASMAVLLVLPLAIVEMLLAPLTWLGILHRKDEAPGTPFAKVLLWPARLLGLLRAADAPSLPGALATALVSTIVLIALWPLLREAGCNLAMLTRPPSAPYTYTWNEVQRSLEESLASVGYWQRLWRWEAWSVGRWWLLFGGMTLAWVAATWPLRGRWQLERPAAVLARFLAFTPWFVVLEVGFLLGVWLTEPAVVPEPSTGFVAGIFSWDLWHWNGWQERVWLTRGALPTWLAGLVFFWRVLGWRPHAAMLAALLLVPPALILSVACTVAYQNGFPEWF